MSASVSCGPDDTRAFRRIPHRLGGLLVYCLFMTVKIKWSLTFGPALTIASAWNHGHQDMATTNGKGQSQHRSSDNLCLNYAFVYIDMYSNFALNKWHFIYIWHIFRSKCTHITAQHYFSLCNATLLHAILTVFTVYLRYLLFILTKTTVFTVYLRKCCGYVRGQYSVGRGL